MNKYAQVQKDYMYMCSLGKKKKKNFVMNMLIDDVGL